MSKLNPKEILQRITGFSTPLGGLQWEPVKNEKKIIQSFMTFLEDRRVLFNPFYVEEENQVIQSVLRIRSEVNNTISNLPENSPAVGPLKVIRAACRRFLDEPHTDYPHLERRYGRHQANSSFFVSLGEMRATVGIQIATIAEKYGLSLDEELASILPAEDKDW